MSNIFMRIPDLKGSVSSKGHQDWIALNGIDFESSRNVTTRVGNVANREMSKPFFSEVEVIKQLDPASNGLFQSLYNAKVWPQVEFHVCHTDDEMKPYAKYVLNDVMIAHHSHSIVEGAAPMEKLFLNYVKLEMTYVGTDKTGKATSQNVISYDLAKAKGT